VSSPPPARAQGVAAIAQSLLITGGTLASFGLTARSFLRQQSSGGARLAPRNPAIQPRSS
jgi:hypothetical protein